MTIGEGLRFKEIDGELYYTCKDCEGRPFDEYFNGCTPCNSTGFKLYRGDVKEVLALLKDVNIPEPVSFSEYDEDLIAFRDNQEDAQDELKVIYDEI